MVAKRWQNLFSDSYLQSIHSEAFSPWSWPRIETKTYLEMTYLPTYLGKFEHNSGEIMTKEIKNHNGPVLF